jgi:hypothetical protein
MQKDRSDLLTSIVGWPRLSQFFALQWGRWAWWPTKRLENAMNKLIAALLVTGVAVMGGCATVSPDEPAQKANNTLRTAKEYATGSRLAKPTTPHMVKSVGNDEYTQYNEHKSLGNVVGAKSN